MFYAGQIKPKPPDIWRLRLEDGRIAYEVSEIESCDCPVFAITAESRWLVNLEAGTRRVKDAAGGTMFGADSRFWPAWWFDALAVIETCRVLECNARIEAESQGMRKC